jgi:hypothetical protein
MLVGPTTKYTAIWHNGENVLIESDKQRQQRTGPSSNELADQAAAAVQKTPNRVTLESLRAKIVNREFIHPTSIPHMTICVLMLENGFAVVGKSTPADAANFNPELGEKFALEDAERHIWPLEAYLLREKMMTEYAGEGVEGAPA